MGDHRWVNILVRIGHSMALNGLFCAYVPLRNYSLIHSIVWPRSCNWLIVVQCCKFGLYAASGRYKLEKNINLRLKEYPAMCIITVFRCRRRQWLVSGMTAATHVRQPITAITTVWFISPATAAAGWVFISFAPD